MPLNKAKKIQTKSYMTYLQYILIYIYIHTHIFFFTAEKYFKKIHPKQISFFYIVSAIKKMIDLFFFYNKQSIQMKRVNKKQINPGLHT